ncbi:hypothetical protein V6N13_147612 [Hibiscus sabdariffa]
MTSGYGPGVAGIFLPEYEEKVIAIKKGDAIALPFGVITWWYNKDDTELVVLFMGDTSKSHKSDTAKALIGNQNCEVMVKLDPNVKMHEPKSDNRKGMGPVLVP